MDREARDGERRWRSDPGDLEALERAISLRRRAGETVPWSMLEARRLPPRAFACRARLEVSAVLPVGKVHTVGRTPSRVQLPRHRRWWVRPLAEPTRETIEDLADALAEAEVEGLLLPATGLSNRRLLLPLQRAASLTLLDLSKSDLLSAPGLRHVAELKRLEVLVLGRTEMLSYLDALAALPLTFVGLDDAPVTPRGLENLVGFAGLTGLSLRGQSLTPELLGALGDLPDLESIQLSGGALGENLARLPAKVRHLSLAWTDVGGADLDPVAALTCLERLDLAGCPRVTDVGLEPLAALPRLTALDLRSCAGLRTLDPLLTEGAFPALKRIDLKGTRLPIAQLDRLRSRRPALDVQS